jgi:hypothetical protein
MRAHTDSIDTAYNRGLLERVAARSAKKRSEYTKAPNRWKRATTWLLNRGVRSSRGTHVQPLSSDTLSIVEPNETTCQTQESLTMEPDDSPSYRLIRRGLKHYDSSGLPGTMDVYSKSELRLRREKKTLSVGESSLTRPIQTRTLRRRSNSDSQMIIISKELNTRATTSESFDVLPPMFNPDFKVYMNTRLAAQLQLREEDRERESCCECLIS